MNRVADRFVAFLDARRKRGEPVLWEGEFAYESLAEVPRFVALPEEGAECLAIPFQRLASHARVRAYLNENGLEAASDKIFDAELLEACEFIERHVSVVLHSISREPRKMSIHLDGAAFGRPQRAYSLNFVDDREYCVHVYSLENSGEKRMLAHAFVRYSKM